MMLSSMSLGLTQPIGLDLTQQAAAVFAAYPAAPQAWYDPSDINLSWRRNLLTYSEQFDSAVWVKTNCTAVAGLVTTTSTGDGLSQAITNYASNASHSFTWRISAGTAAWLRFVIYQTAATTNRVSGWFNLSTAEVGSSTNGGTGTGAALTVVSLGGGSYDVTLTGAVNNAATAVTVQVSTANANGSTTGVSGVAYTVSRAQLELGSTATDYQRITDGLQDYYTYAGQPVMFQDSAGTTPVTALGQPVGRMLDKSGKGNHLIQATALSRPTLQARVNLLTYSEQFDNAAWVKVNATVTTNATTAPAGIQRADKLVENTATGVHVAVQTASLTSGFSYTFTLLAKAAERTRLLFEQSSATVTAFTALVDFSAGTVVSTTGSVTASIAAIGDGWYRVSLVVLAASTGTGGVQIDLVSTGSTVSYTGNGTSGIFISGADFRLSTFANLPYQRVTTATDYADIGAPRYLAFDGVDDGMVSAANFDMTSTDAVTVSAGVRKLSDAAVGLVAELSVDSSLNTGTFLVRAPNTAASTTVAYTANGTTAKTSQNASIAAPVTAVFTGQTKISTPRTSLRTNGVLSQEVLTTLGTGNFGTYPLYVGRRGGTTLPFNGNLYGLQIIGATLTTAEILTLERFNAAKTQEVSIV